MVRPIPNSDRDAVDQKSLDVIQKARSETRARTKHAIGNGITIGWIGCPAICAVDLGFGMGFLRKARPTSVHWMRRRQIGSRPLHWRLEHRLSAVVGQSESDPPCARLRPPKSPPPQAATPNWSGAPLGATRLRFAPSSRRTIENSTGSPAASCAM